MEYRQNKDKVLKNKQQPPHKHGQKKHLTDLERLEIEHALRQGASLKKIAAKIGKHHSTVAREILARSVASDKGAFGRVTNRCVSRLSCDRRQLCADRPDCVKRCPACRLCNPACPDFREEACPKLAAPPYVCNGGNTARTAGKDVPRRFRPLFRQTKHAPRRIYSVKG